MIKSIGFFVFVIALFFIGFGAMNEVLIRRNLPKASPAPATAPTLSES